MLTPIYRFYIATDSVKAEIQPHYSDLSKIYAKESGQEFFRTSIEGQLSLFGKDYELVNSANLDTQFTFIIEKYDRQLDAWKEYYKGEFNKTDCKFDYERKKCELNISPIDEYNEVMNNYDNTYDLLKLAPAISKINMHKRPLIQVYIAGANSVSNFLGGTYWESDVHEAVSKHKDLLDKYCFAFVCGANELYVEGASIKEINGIYTGTKGQLTKWDSGYTFKMVESFVQPDYIYYVLVLVRNSDNKVMYRLDKSMIGLAPSYKSPFIPSGLISSDSPLVMVNEDNPKDTFNIETCFGYPIYQRILADVDNYTDATGSKPLYDIPIDDFIVDNKNYKKCIGLEGGNFFCVSKTVDEPTRYGMNDYGKYFTDQFLPATTGLHRPLPISRNSWANASLWFVYDELIYSIFEPRLRKKYVLKDSYSIAATIQALLNKIAPGIKHEGTAEYSQFLYSDANPLGARRFYVYLTQKTNILKGDYDQAAQRAEISLKMVMEMLRDCFRCYWYIEDNKLKIEHAYFFINGGSYLYSPALQLDFTKLTDQFNKKYTSYFQSEIEYDKSSLSQRYEFSWMDDVTDVFGGVYIDVKANYIQKDKKEDISVSDFCPDVDFMLLDPSRFSNDGFALLCPVKNENNELELPIVTLSLLDDNRQPYQAIVQNWYASWSYLVNFYMYDMPATEIECNTVSIFTAFVKMCMKHNIEFPTEEDLDALKLIKTNIGTGKIDKISINMVTRKASVTLIYRPK